MDAGNKPLRIDTWTIERKRMTSLQELLCSCAHARLHLQLPLSRKYHPSNTQQVESWSTLDIYRKRILAKGPVNDGI
jgi:hypothetical protein